MKNSMNRNVLVYISGKYSGDIDENIKVARKYAIKIWELGYTALTPALNSAHFEIDCNCKYEDYINGDLIMLDRCDIIFMLPGWQESKGANVEIRFAKRKGMKIVFDLE